MAQLSQEKYAELSNKFCIDLNEVSLSAQAYIANPTTENLKKISFEEFEYFDEIYLVLNAFMNPEISLVELCKAGFQTSVDTDGIIISALAMGWIKESEFIQLIEMEALSFADEADAKLFAFVFAGKISEDVGQKYIKTYYISLHPQTQVDIILFGSDALKKALQE